MLLRQIQIIFIFYLQEQTEHFKAFTDQQMLELNFTKPGDNRYICMHQPKLLVMIWLLAVQQMRKSFIPVV
jgi:hypothetical protein